MVVLLPTGTFGVHPDRDGKEQAKKAARKSRSSRKVSAGESSREAAEEWRDVDCVDARAHGHEPFLEASFARWCADAKEDGWPAITICIAPRMATGAFLMHEVWNRGAP